MIIPWNRIFSGLVVLALLISSAFAQQSKLTAELQTAAPQTAASSEGISVLILGDSLALCGFGKRLDDRFRKNPKVKATFTYLACGTNPLSWLKDRPYTNIKTHCGFVSIESNGPGRAKILEDVYGMRRGHVPIPHSVPKLEDLLATLRPDILIMQTGTNLFDIFPDHKTVIAAPSGSRAPNLSGSFHRQSGREFFHVKENLLGRVSHFRESLEGDPGLRGRTNAHGHRRHRQRHR